MRTLSPQNRMRLIRTIRLGPAFALSAALLVIAPDIHAAEYVEISAELNSTWQSRTTTNLSLKTTRCISGTDGWFISGDFLKNAKIDYWLFGTNVIEQTTVSSSMYLEQAKDFVSENILRQKPSLSYSSY